MKKILTILFIMIVLFNQYDAQTLDSLNHNNTSRTEIVFYETGIGVLTSIVALLPAGLLVNFINKPKDYWDSMGNGIIAIPIALVVGGSLGVHLIDRKYNKYSSYLLAFGGATLGFGLSYYILLNATEPISGLDAVLVGIAPLTFSIIAVNLINYESKWNKLKLSYQPEIILNEVIHKINIKINL